MDDGTQVSKYLLEPAFLRELYLFELATTIALMRENMSNESFGTGSDAGGQEAMGMMSMSATGAGAVASRKRTTRDSN